MKPEILCFGPISDKQWETTRYYTYVSAYDNRLLPGVMISFSMPGASLTMHNISAENLRKLAFLFSSMAEDMERQQEELTTNTIEQ